MKKNYLLVTLFGLFCFGVVFFGLRSYIHWKGNYYFGQVTSVTETNFTLLGKGSYEYVVDLTPDTVVRKGLRVHGSVIRSGDRVIVVGKAAPDKHIDASLVRILGYKESNISTQ